MSLLLKNGMIVNDNNKLERCELLIENGYIKQMAPYITSETAQVIDVADQLIIPGMVDLHVHLREPGGEHKETIATGTKAAAKGGFTTIAAMPNTRPVPDNKETLEELQERIAQTSEIRVLPYGAITARQIGQSLTDFESLKEAGAFAFTDDGVGVQDANMMLDAMKLAQSLDVAIVAHCEENTLINKGAVHEGTFSKEHSLNGIPSVCESVHIARDVLLAEAAKAHYHVCHISTKESVRVVRDAKRAGIQVTAEVTPHHLLLCDEDIPELDSNYKMNPPLRGEADRDALISGLLDGTIDFIATDHAPHTKEEKAAGMERAPFGIVGLETAFPLLYTYLVKKGVITLKQLVKFMTSKPADAFQLPYGQLQIGGLADIAVVNLNLEQKIEAVTFLSKGKNTPFNGWVCNGWPTLTIAKGNIVWQTMNN